MSSERSRIYSAFNARWLSEEDVARTFVVSSSFHKILRPTHSLLMGPRGCGKTTALKMLTRRAVQSWENFDATKNLTSPAFETVYVPLDIAFSAELASLSDISAEMNLTTQRVMVNLAVVISMIETFEEISRAYKDLESQIAVQVIRTLHLRSCTARLSDVKTAILAWGDRIQRLLNTGKAGMLDDYLNHMPDILFLKVYQPVIRLGQIFNTVAEDRINHWCLAFDELEIGPDWLQQELLQALRSTHQSLYLKLTWSPVLPQDIKSVTPPPKGKADFDVVRMWYSHASDARSFSRELMERIARSRFGEDVTTDQLFGHSEFSRLTEAEPYSSDDPFVRRMQSLRKKDYSFRSVLDDHDIQLKTNVDFTTHQKDKVIRKLKPIVILRDELRKSGGLRSRKTLGIYSGEDIISLMSDGNPRWLSIIVSELLDTIPSKEQLPAQTPVIPENQQSRILTTISRRMLAWMKATPRPVTSTASNRISLEVLIGTIGHYFFHHLIADEFTLDPVGSFWIDSQANATHETELIRGIIEGAFLFVGGSEADVPEEVEGARLRLSFMFSPEYRLPLRNYRALSLSRLLKESKPSQSSRQPELPYNEP